jgi:hypothetical protein
MHSFLEKREEREREMRRRERRREVYWCVIDDQQVYSADLMSKEFGINCPH